MPFDPVIERGVFDPKETIVLLADAFEAACKELRYPKRRSARELVAARIIAAARRGELDRVRLRNDRSEQISPAALS